MIEEKYINTKTDVNVTNNTLIIKTYYSEKDFWILRNNIWEDLGIWDDNKFWND